MANNVETTDTDDETAATEPEAATANDELVDDPAAPQVVSKSTLRVPQMARRSTATCIFLQWNPQHAPVSVLPCAAMAGKRYGTFRPTSTAIPRPSVWTFVPNWKAYKLRTHSCRSGSYVRGLVVICSEGRGRMLNRERALILKLSSRSPRPPPPHTPTPIHPIL